MLMSGSWHVYRTGEKWWMGRSRMRVAIRVGALQAEGRGETQGSLHSVLRAPVEMTAMSDGSSSLAGSSSSLAGGSSSIADVGWEAVAFNVPVVEFHTARSLERSTQIPKLGPDLLSDEFTVEGGVERMAAYGIEHPEAEVGVTLLNQRVLAGLGNVYKSEVAFAAGVNPFRQMRTVTARERERMVEFSLRWMRANVANGAGEGIVTYAGNRRTTHSSNREDRLWVYGRQGKECRRCGATVMMRKQGEQARSTYWCPACQPWVPAEGQSGEAPVGGAFGGSRRRKTGC